jgi:type IV pilus assembly protein PilA
VTVSATGVITATGQSDVAGLVIQLTPDPLANAGVITSWTCAATGNPEWAPGSCR